MAAALDLSTAPALNADEFRAYRRRAIFECGKLDPQNQDQSVLAAFPLVLSSGAWSMLGRAAESLDAELLAAERALLDRPDLHPLLGLPPKFACQARRTTVAACDGGPRVCRYDFHPTPDGWACSEANCDVPGGYIESSCLAALMAERHPSLQACGDPAGALCAALGEGPVALVHATGYIDDAQVMTYLSRRLAASGCEGIPCAPDHLRFARGGVECVAGGRSRGVRAIFRFYPAEWLPNLGRGKRWRGFFHADGATLCNPAAALLSQSKRAPIAWRELGLDTPSWNTWTPEVRDPRDVPRSEHADWVLKPALGRVGAMVAIEGVSSPRVVRAARWWSRLLPRRWAAQRRFAAAPVQTPDGPRYPTVGVFVIDGRAAGAYGRIAARPLIDWEAQDAPVLAERERAAPAAVGRAVPGGLHVA